MALASIRARLIRVYIYAVVCVLMAANVWSDEFLTTAVKEAPVISFENKIQVLIDPEHSLTIADVLSGGRNFSQVEAFPAMGYTRDVIWFRFSVIREKGASAARVLKLMPSYLDHASVWLIQNKAILSHHRVGRRDPSGNGYILPDALQARIDLPEGLSTVYIRVKSGTTIALRPVMFSPDEYLRSNEKTTFRLGLFSGLMLLVFIFNAGCWVMTRDSLYGLFSGYVGFGLLGLMEGTGLIGSFFWEGWRELSWRPLSVFIGCTWVFSTWFFLKQFELKKNHPVVYAFNIALLAVTVAAAVAGFSGGYAYSYVYDVIVPLALVVHTMTFWPVWCIVRNSALSPSARVMGLAYIPYVLFNYPNLFFVAGILPPSMLNLLGLVQGSVIQVAVLQIAVIYRVRDIQRERNCAVEEVLQTNAVVDRERRIRGEQSRFLSMITHEIRTPLAVIDMAVQSIRVLDAEQSSARNSRYSRIQSAVKRMATLLELGLKKDDVNGEIWTPDESVNLVDLSYHLQNQFPVDEQERIEINCSTGAVCVKGNNAALKMVFFNLVENSFKYSGERHPVHITVSRSGKDVVWQVDDAGVGVPAGQEEKIFEKFYRAGDDTGKPGLGLGLYIARQVMMRHGGQIEYKGSILGGACFRCVFPGGE